MSDENFKSWVFALLLALVVSMGVLIGLVIAMGINTGALR